MIFAAFLLPIVLAGICPMIEHETCNSGEHACVCAISRFDERPAPQASCNTLILREPETNLFPVVSIEFNLDDKADGLESWPEESFRDVIASSLRVDEEDILILRANCQGTENQLTVQFGILKKNMTSEDAPYDVDDFTDAKSVASRIKNMGHLSRIADLDVDSVTYTLELIDIEYDPDNADLISEAFVVAVAAILAILLGFYFSCRKSDYSDDLQNA